MSRPTPFDELIKALEQSGQMVHSANYCSADSDMAPSVIINGLREAVETPGVTNVTMTVSAVQIILDVIDGKRDLLEFDPNEDPPLFV